MQDSSTRGKLVDLHLEIAHARKARHENPDNVSRKYRRRDTHGQTRACPVHNLRTTDRATFAFHHDSDPWGSTPSTARRVNSSTSGSVVCLPSASTPRAVSVISKRPKAAVALRFSRKVRGASWFDVTPRIATSPRRSL